MPVVCCLLKNDLYSKLILESINMETISCEFEESQITHSAEVNDFQVTSSDWCNLFNQSRGLLTTFAVRNQ